MQTIKKRVVQVHGGQQTQQGRMLPHALSESFIPRYPSCPSASNEIAIVFRSSWTSWCISTTQLYTFPSQPLGPRSCDDWSASRSCGESCATLLVSVISHADIAASMTSIAWELIVSTATRRAYPAFVRIAWRTTGGSASGASASRSRSVGTTLSPPEPIPQVAARRTHSFALIMQPSRQSIAVSPIEPGLRMMDPSLYALHNNSSRTLVMYPAAKDCETSKSASKAL